MGENQDDRQARLAAALRENLQRRKGLARKKAVGPGAEEAPGDPTAGMPSPARGARSETEDESSDDGGGDDQVDVRAECAGGTPRFRVDS